MSMPQRCVRMHVCMGSVLVLVLVPNFHADASEMCVHAHALQTKSRTPKSSVPNLYVKSKLGTRVVEQKIVPSMENTLDATSLQLP